MTDIQMIKGDTTTFEVAVTRYNSTTGLDVPVNLTGSKVWFTAKRTRRDTDASAFVLLNSTINPSQIIIVAPATNGIISITLTPADTETFSDKWLMYDVQLRESDNTITTVQSGRLELIRDSTKTRT